MNPGENLGISLALMIAAGAITSWNIARLRATRPTLDKLVAALGAAAILAVVVGTSLVATQVGECALNASSLPCNGVELVLVGLMDLAVATALITAWLRADACHATFAPGRVDPRRIPKTRRQRTVAGELRI